jgi:hypothetical protein
VTPVQEIAQGDTNCSSNTGIGGVDSLDALVILRFVAALPVTQNEPCPDIGSNAGKGSGGFGDVDCSGEINAVDALKILRHAAELSVSQTQPCTPMGIFPAEGT